MYAVLRLLRSSLVFLYSHPRNPSHLCAAIQPELGRNTILSHWLHACVLPARRLPWSGLRGSQTRSTDKRFWRRSAPSRWSHSANHSRYAPRHPLPLLLLSSLCAVSDVCVLALQPSLLRLRYTRSLRFDDARLCVLRQLFRDVYVRKRHTDVTFDWCDPTINPALAARDAQ